MKLRHHQAKAQRDLIVARVDPRDMAFRYVAECQTPTPVIAAYVFVDDGTESDKTLMDWVVHRAARIAVLRQRMVQPYGHLGYNHWADVGELNFDKQFVLHRVADWVSFTELLADIQAESFDWSRPPWRIHIVRGLRGVDQWAQECTVAILSIHHSAADGAGCATIMQSLFSAEAIDEADDYGSAKVRSRATLTAYEIAGSPLWIPRLIRDVYRMKRARRLYRKDLAVTEVSKSQELPLGVSINHPVGKGRIIDVLFTPIADIHAAKNRMGHVSVNDIVLSVIGAALANFVGSAADLYALLPISTRDVAGVGSRNAVVNVAVNLYTSEKDITLRAASIHSDVQAARKQVRSRVGIELAEAFPPMLPGFAFCGLGRIASRRASEVDALSVVDAHSTISSIRDEPIDARRLGALSAVATFGIPVVSGRRGIEHLVYRSGDWLTVGVCADPDQVGNLSSYMRELRSGFSALSNGDVTFGQS